MPGNCAMGNGLGLRLISCQTDGKLVTLDITQAPITDATNEVEMRNYENDSNNIAIAEQYYLHTTQSGAIVPLIQSVITGALITAPIVIILIKINAEDIFTWGLLVFFSVTAGMWIYSWMHWLGLTLEHLTGIDINGDGRIGDEIVRPVRVDIEEMDDNIHITTRARFPSERKLIAVADAIVNGGASFSVREIVEQRKLLSRSEFEEMREEMLARGMVTLKNPEYPKLGYDVTRAGRAVFRDILDRPPLPY